MQRQGNSSSDAGRLDGSLGSPVTAANIALGVGWGDGAVTKEVVAGSTDQRGEVIITSAGSNQAQATATVALTFADGAYASVPFALLHAHDDNAATTAQPTAKVVTATGLSWKAAVLPVATKIYRYTWCVIA